MTHCYGTLGVGRDDWPDTGSGARALRGHRPGAAPARSQHRGRRPRAARHGTAVVAAARHAARSASTKSPSNAPRSSRRASPPTLPESERIALEVLRTDTPLFTKYVESRRNRRDDWYIVPAGHIDVCNVAIPVRDATSSRIRAPMGRIFEVRKHTMFARWDRMAKQFARIAKDINMAVKAGGSDAELQSRRCAARCRTPQPQHAEGQGRGRDQARARQGRDRLRTDHLRGLRAARRRGHRRSRDRQSRRAPWRRCARSSPRAAAISARPAAWRSSSARWACSA